MMLVLFNVQQQGEQDTCDVEEFPRQFSRFGSDPRVRLSILNIQRQLFWHSRRQCCDSCSCDCSYKESLAVKPHCGDWELTGLFCSPTRGTMQARRLVHSRAIGVGNREKLEDNLKINEMECLKLPTRTVEVINKDLKR